MSRAPMGSLKGYAKFMRAVRSRQPKVSSAEAHDQARRALATVGQQKGTHSSAEAPPALEPAAKRRTKQPPADTKTPGSSAGRDATAG